jgi:hypothetical protein
MATYQEGDLVRIDTTITNAAGTKIDPTALTAYYRTPGGVTTTLVYLTDAALVRESTGVYYVHISATEPGPWFYSFKATGTGQSADESHFNVVPSIFF